MSQKTDNMIKLALVFFVSLLSFSIGTYVGKKYSDNQHKLALLEPKKETTTTAKTEEFASDVTETEKAHGIAATENTATDHKPAALTDSEVAKIAEEFASDDATDEKALATIEPQEKELKSITNSGAVVEKPVVKPVAKPVAVAKTEVQPSPRNVPAVQPSAPVVKPVAAVKVEERIPASIAPKKEITPMHFTVQIGSFPTQAEAEKMTKDLQGRGFKTTFVPAKVNGQTWFRVNVGLFGSVKEAQDYKKEFLEKTKLSSAIVQRVF